MKNKKGFTLIEMLVVIAIIAILVAVIIPVVQNSTIRAAAAANAANLRNVQGQIQTMRLLEPDKFDYITVQTAENGVLTFGQIVTEAPTAQGMEGGGIKVPKGTQMRVQRNGEQIICTYRGYTVEMFAEVAENGYSDKAITNKDQVMNDAEDLNDRFDQILEDLNDKYGTLDDATMDKIQEVADKITDLTNTMINGTDSSGLVNIIGGLLNGLGGLLG